MMNLSLDAVEALEAIADAGSFQAAAHRLRKAQSAISYAIKQLESSLGVTLFDRSGHRATLTPAGVALLDEGRSLLARARRMESLARQFSAGFEPRLDLIVDGVVPMQPILAALKQLGDEGVPTHIQVTMEYLSGVQRRFERDDADLMIAMSWQRRPNLTAWPLPEVTLVLVASAQHPAAQSREPHTVRSLQPHIELSVHDSSDATRGLDTNEFGGGRVFYLSDFHSKGEALRLGLGYGWMPLALVADDLTCGRLVALPFTEGGRRTFTPMLIHREDRALGRTGSLLRARLTRQSPVGSGASDAK